MKNEDKWLPTKYCRRNGQLIGSRNPSHVQASSLLITDRVAAAYDTAITRHVRGDLLDLGCGQAPLFDTYRSLCRSVTCLDWPGSPHNVQHADVLCDVNEQLPLADASFDVVICSDVLEHLHNPNMAMSEMSRVLRPGGKVLLSVPFIYGIHEQPYDFHRYTRFAIEHMSRFHGLGVVELNELGGAGDVLCNLIAKLTVKIPLAGNPIARLQQTIWNLARTIRPIRRLDEKTAAQFPLEYFAVLNKVSPDAPKD